MAKRYDQASQDVTDRIAKLRTAWYEHLSLFSIGALFVANEDGEQCLTHAGYPALAVTRIVPARDRAAGLPDVQIVIDLAAWQSLADSKKKNALLDHELYHIEPVLDDIGGQIYDAQDRPKATLRKHDHQLGWFDEIANRHGDNSIEVTQARKLIAESGQLYFDFVLPESLTVAVRSTVNGHPPQ